jgi:VWFA-related protein
MCISPRSLLVATLVSFAAGLGNAQPPASQTAPPKLVTLSVVALTDRGQPVNDLTAADFAVTDAGKHQDITIFRQTAATAPAIEAPRPGEFSNRTAATVPHATIVLFDMLNEDADLQGTVGEFVARGLQSIDSADYLYLYLLTPEPRIYPVRGLPGPAAPAPETTGPEWTKNAKALIEQAAAKAYKVRPREMKIDERIRLTHSALERVGGLIAGVPGRKSIVWITHGVPVSLGSGFDAIDYEPWFRRLGSAFSRASVALYPVMQAGNANTGYIPLRNQDTLRLLAELTGGPRIADDVGATVRRAMADMRSGYLLGYLSAAENWDGAFHKVSVMCRKAGVRVQAASGYEAKADAASTDLSVLDRALLSPFESAEIGIRGAVSSGAAEPGGGPGKMTRFELRVDPAGVRITRGGDRYKARLALQFAGSMADGKTERLRPVLLDLEMSPDDYAQVQKNGIPFTREILLGGTVQKMRVAVFDRATHATGTLTIPLDPK